MNLKPAVVSSPRERAEIWPMEARGGVAHSDSGSLGQSGSRPLGGIRALLFDGLEQASLFTTESRHWPAFRPACPADGLALAGLTHQSLLQSHGHGRHIRNCSGMWGLRPTTREWSAQLPSQSRMKGHAQAVQLLARRGRARCMGRGPAGQIEQGTSREGGSRRLQSTKSTRTTGSTSGQSFRRSAE